MSVVNPAAEAVAALEDEQPIMVDSDATDNAAAISEIEAWCRQHGLRRVRENWLRVVRTARGPVRRGTCYRPAGDPGEEYQDFFEQVARRVDPMPDTGSSVEQKRG
jgi:hypothetical protein